MKKNDEKSDSKQLTKRLNLYLIFFLFSASVIAQETTVGEIMGLEQCIETGLLNNPQFLSSEILLEKTRAAIEESKSGFYPQVMFTSGASNNSRENNSINYNNYSAGVSMSYNIFQGYKTKSQAALAQDNYLASENQHLANRQNLIFSIIQSYYRTLQAERILKSSEEAVKRSTLHLDYARAKQQAGMATKSDVLKSEVELSNAEIARITAENYLLTIRGTLNLLIGLPSDNETQIIDDLSEGKDISGLSYDSLLLAGLNSRPEIARFSSLLNAQSNKIQIARSGSAPSLSTEANFNYAGTALSSLQNNWIIGMTLSVPLFKGFYNRSRVTQEKLALTGLEKDLDQLKQEVGQEIWNSWLAVRESAERIGASLKAEESARENLELAEGEYREGVGSILQLTDAQYTYVTALQSHVQSLADFKISFAELERMTGKQY
jgi:outer membrane protein TolC